MQNNRVANTDFKIASPSCGTHRGRLVKVKRHHHAQLVPNKYQKRDLKILKKKSEIFSFSDFEKIRCFPILIFEIFLRTCLECVVYGKINTLLITASKTVVILRYIIFRMFFNIYVVASFRGRDVRRSTTVRNNAISWVRVVFLEPYRSGVTEMMDRRGDSRYAGRECANDNVSTG